MRKRPLRTKFEEIRQASSIHGGMVNFCVAALGVKLSRVKIPSRRLRTLVYRTIYGKKYTALDEAELEKPIWAYSSLNALFTRGVRPEFRPIPQATDQLLCPCDGTVQDVGRITDERLITVKGVTYTISSLLPGIDADGFRDGHFAILFLAPNDCHRVFSPQDARIEEVIHVPGYRLLVHPPYQRKEYPVFSLNERVILRLSTALGACILVLVAGWGVGNITLAFDARFRPRARKVSRTRYDVPVLMKKGEWLATFELGSTAILITEPAQRVITHLTRDEKVKYGQPAFSVAR
ncbi:MAG TPA: archaetidylserine decarboxylase [Gemmataceae bacterium]|nr:archaetidylserine decarboxylase [Gemmataceae bacterium]